MTAPTYEVTRANFEKQTGNAKPWEQGFPEKRQYSICPVCNNPVRLVGIYKATIPKPYGAHAGETVEGLPIHNLQKYEYCTLSRKGKRVNDTERFDKPDASQKELCHILCNNFHKVVYVIEKVLGIQGSTAFWRTRLEQFMASKGYMCATPA